MFEAQLHVIGIAGSLRRGSFNRSLLMAARELALAPLEIEPFDIASVPFYNQDLDNDDDRPEAVRRLKRAIADADAVLISSPEYNHSVPGVLQNTIDWVSRPAGRSPLRGKPFAIMGASTSLIGTARAQQQLKLVLMSAQALVMPHAGVAVASAKEKFDEAGALVHEPTRTFLSAFLRDFEQWIQEHGPVRERVR